MTDRLHTPSAIEQRNRDFIRVCRQVAATRRRLGRSMARRAIVSDALAVAPQCFYVNRDTASRALHTLHHGGFHHRHAREQWAEFQTQVQETMERRRCTVSQAIDFVLNFRRPTRFHITHRHANRLYGRYLRGLKQ